MIVFLGSFKKIIFSPDKRLKYTNLRQNSVHAIRENVTRSENCTVHSMLQWSLTYPDTSVPNQKTCFFR